MCIPFGVEGQEDVEVASSLKKLVIKLSFGATATGRHLTDWDQDQDADHQTQQNPNGPGTSPGRGSNGR
jgi:hypothetical protein